MCSPIRYSYLSCGREPPPDEPLAVDAPADVATAAPGAAPGTETPSRPTQPNGVLPPGRRAGSTD
ncbi:MAG TPA: hypothetical protein VMF14_00800 [Solirubrobacteraceae bacterium]|nr:hypothetical protein [Solirubrobacteraceae bacterium]